MAETLVFAWNFCCRCREASLIERLENLLIKRFLAQTQLSRQIPQVSLNVAFSLGDVFSPKAMGMPNWQVAFSLESRLL